MELEYIQNTILPPLFGKDKNGKDRIWKCWVEGDTVHRISGLVEGKKVTSSKVHLAKNVGKSNETTAEEQAIRAAETLWVKQLDKNYLPSPDDEEGEAMLNRINEQKEANGGHNINSAAAIRGRTSKKSHGSRVNLCVDRVDVNITPMKAGVWELEDNGAVKSKVLKHFDFGKGVYVQWKLDGWRCIAKRQSDGSIVLTTNNKKQYPWFQSLRESIETFMRGREEDCIDGLDGEIYAHTLVDENGVEFTDEARFSTICSMCGLKRSEPHPLEDQIQFVVFDLVDLSSRFTQNQRFAKLKRLFATTPSHSRVKMCETRVFHDIQDIYEYHDKIAAMGYEGVIIRADDLKYQEKRSLKMRKYKKFIDREYTVVGVHKDPGVDDEYFVWECIDYDIDKRFRAKPRGTREQRRMWYTNYSEYIGMKLTVRFQEYSEDHIPRFPIGVGIREDQ